MSTKTRSKFHIGKPKGDKVVRPTNLIQTSRSYKGMYKKVRVTIRRRYSYHMILADNCILL